ncbi:hypothetical protein DQ384_17320 [Sphaerisporangium album]|uniref:Uncharacterized protein n=1 Tax=Sphaerisporangium album TaxID=509200 RepID=A0A367FI01_9ACTN|nr:hypothetical protein DQ384_17320 [Sphaerisporangium album]
MSPPSGGYVLVVSHLDAVFQSGGGGGVCSVPGGEVTNARNSRTGQARSADPATTRRNESGFFSM